MGSNLKKKMKRRGQKASARGGSARSRRSASKRHYQQAAVDDRRAVLKEHAQERREKLQEKANEETELHGRQVRNGDIFKIVGLVAFIAIMALVCWLLWPYIHDLFEPGGVDKVINDIRAAGPMGFLILLALQFLQIVVAFIPGEATQMAAGMLYGPWVGSLILIVGCVLSSAFVFTVVHRLGAPFVRDMVSEKWMTKFDKFQKSGKLELTIFILFLIPAMPKDVFTYLVPLTEMRMRTFLVLTNVARIPGILVSTYAASGLVDGNVWQSIVIFAVFAVVAVVCLIFRERLMGSLEKLSHKK